MAGGLFGELEIGKSKGYSKGTYTAFLKPNQLCYISGNAINVADISAASVTAKEDDSITPSEPKPVKVIPEHTHCKLITAESQIDAFSVYARANIIAYADQKSQVVSLFRLNSTIGGPTTLFAKFQLPNKGLRVQQLAFSFDGQYLVALSDLPDYEITVWDWRAKKQIASTPNGNPCKCISFNPSDSSQLCTSGVEGHIKFWKLKVGFRKYLFNGVDGAEFPYEPPQEAETPVNIHNLRYDPSKVKSKEPMKVSPFKHAWFVDNQLFASSEDGNEVYTYDPLSGACEVVFSLSRDTTTKLSDIVQSDIPLSERGCFKQIAVNTEGFIFGGKDGIVRWVSSEGDVKVAVNVCQGTSIAHLTISPDFRSLLVEDEAGRLFVADLVDADATLISNNESVDIIAAATSTIDQYGITISETGRLMGWNLDSGLCFFSQVLPIHPTCISLSSVSFLAAIGTKEGYLRIYDFSKIRESQVRLVCRYKLHSMPVMKVFFDPSGRYAASVSADGNAFFVDVGDSFKPIGYVSVPGTFAGACWSFEEEDEGKPGYLRFYLATFDPAQKFSSIFRFELPLQGQLTLKDDDGLQLNKSVLQQIMYRLDDRITDFVILPSHLTGGRETFYFLSDGLKLKLATGPSASQIAGDKIQLPISSHEYNDHQTKGVQMCLSNSREWLLTWGSDGLLTVRSLLEPEKAVKIYAHDPLLGGVRCAALSRDCRQIISAGHDGIVRKWDWKYTMAGKRIAADLTDHAFSFEESNANWAEQTSMRADQYISQNPQIAKKEQDSEKAEALIDQYQRKSGSEPSSNAHKEKQDATLVLRTKINKITDELNALVAKNETLPELERLDREEFIVDFEERDRLINEADMQIAAVRQEIEEQNLKHRIIRDRLKKECWDSMEVVGQSVKSFNPEPATGHLIDVVNYPIRKRLDAEIEKSNKYKRLRKIQLAILQKTGNNLLAHNSKAADEEAALSEGQKPVFKSDVESLLYDPSELITVERRRMQMALLGEYSIDIKKFFNATFQDYVKMKKDEIAKIEERNDRISSILSQLQLQETIMRPTLDDDEVPQRVIEVLDSEIKVEKFMTQEERKKMEEKRKQDEERARQQAEDNWRQRALMSMMGGKLEDRTEQDEKVELVKPEWMNKNKEDMSEEEKKLLKEFEKKMAIFKEEQEKYRKALETELRKLQASIIEITDQFDASLKELFRLKVSTDQLVFQTELRIIKLGQLCLGSEGDEIKESRLLKRLEQLKLEKTACTSEIPEIKKELEKCREEFEIALKRDKDLEKQFKKEFQQYEALQDSLLKLFKKRSTADTTSKESATAEPPTQPLNPFQDLARGLTDIDLNPPPLDPQTDMPENLPYDAWTKLLDFREKKILSEQDVYSTGKRFTEMQTLVQNVLDDSDRIRNETERTSNELNAFIEYKFQTAQNLEMLFSLKQGQVEVPQAPLVTDYSDAILIHRSAVEKLNENIIGLGQTKVEALTDMKNYRKGIHALEWEIKMLDFQAEDLVIKTRDIQLLRVTKQMQEFIRNGDDVKHSSEIAALEKRGEYNQKAHIHKLNEKKKTVSRLQERIRQKEQENSTLNQQLEELEAAVKERESIHNVKLKKEQHGSSNKDPLKEIYTRRRLIDLAKSQAQDIAILREEVERLRLRTYPAFHAE